jgi:hypothetical protein
LAGLIFADPAILATEIADDLETALEMFRNVGEKVKK